MEVHLTPARDGGRLRRQATSSIQSPGTSRHVRSRTGSLTGIIPPVIPVQTPVLLTNPQGLSSHNQFSTISTGSNVATSPGSQRLSALSIPPPLFSLTSAPSMHALPVGDATNASTNSPWSFLKYVAVIVFLAQVGLFMVYSPTGMTPTSSVFSQGVIEKGVLQIPAMHASLVAFERMDGSAPVDGRQKGSSDPSGTSLRGTKGQGGAAVPKVEKGDAKYQIETRSDDDATLSRRFLLQLSPDRELFSKDFVHIKVTEDEAAGEFKVSFVEDPETDCILTGKDAHSKGNAIVSTCHGHLNGVIHSQDETFYISPSPKTEGENIVYRSRELREQNIGKQGCGAGHEHDRDHEDENDGHGRNLSEAQSNNGVVEQKATGNGSPGVVNEDIAVGHASDSSNGQDKFVKVILVSDSKRYSRIFQSNSQKASASLKNIAAQLKSIYSEFPGDVAGASILIQVVGIVSIETNRDPWTVTQTSTDTVNAATLLSAFNAWRRSSAISGVLPPHTAAHLVSGYTFEGSTVGTATMSSACDVETSGGVNQATSLVDSFVAKILAHELGHNLGLRHTSVYVSGSAVGSGSTVQSCMARDATNVMAAAMPSGSTLFSWEQCSPLWFKMFLRGFPYNCQGSQCTYEKGYVASTSRSLCMDTEAEEIDESTVKCGDGVVEGDEECDCGSLSATECAKVDPCCDKSTCSLKANASCSAKDPCCNPSTCNFVPSSAKKVCRESTGACDAAETCSGRSAFCPADTFKSTGGTCTLQQPAGISTTIKTGMCYNGACLSHDQQCNELKARGGSFSNLLGECSRAGDDDGDLGCGRLYCGEVGSAYCSTNFYTPSLLMVPDGTPCGGGKQCLSGRCSLLGTPDNSGDEKAVGTEEDSDVTSGGYVPEGTSCSENYRVKGKALGGCTSFNKVKPKYRKGNSPVEPSFPGVNPPTNANLIGWCYTGEGRKYTRNQFEWGYCKL